MSRSTEERQHQNDRYSTSVFYSPQPTASGQARRGYQRPQPRNATQPIPAPVAAQRSSSNGSADGAAFSTEVRGHRNGSSQSAHAVVTQRLPAVRDTGDRGEKVFPVNLMHSLDALLKA